MSIRKIINRHLFQLGPSKHEFNVCIIGSNSGTGQILSLLLMLNPMVRFLNLYDTTQTGGDTSTDLSHVRSSVKVRNFEVRKEAMDQADVIIIVGGELRKKDMLRDELFGSNVKLIHQTTLDMADVAPRAILAIVTNPINSLVPVACELLDRRHKLDANRIFGVTTIDTMRAIQMYATLRKMDPTHVELPVIGGHSGKSVVPLISRVTKYTTLSQTEIETLTKNIQNAGTYVIEKRKGLSPTLSMAYAVSKFTGNLLKGLDGQHNIIDTAYVKSDITSAPYFSNPLILGEFGVEENLGANYIHHLSDYEKRLLDVAIEDIKKSAQKAVDYVVKMDSKVKPKG